MRYKPGMIIDGIITGIQPYGAFVAFDDNVIGLIHISEISDGFVKDVNQFVHVKDKVKVKVIDIDETHNQLRLSLKALNTRTRRSQFKRNAQQRLPEMKIGFKSIAEKMPEWIKEAKNND